MRASIVSAPTLSARITKEPVPVTVAPMSLSPDFLAAGINSSVIMDFVHGSVALKHFAIDGYAAARPNSKTVADLNQFKGYFLVLAIGFQAARCLRSQFQQGADRSAGLLAGAQLQHPTQQHENGIHRCGFEINSDRAAHAVKTGGEHVERECRKQAVDVGGSGAEGDQAEHVQASVHD